MNRRSFVLSALPLACTLTRTAQAQKAPPRLGWLHTRGEVFDSPLGQGFLDGMIALGDVEGRDYLIERRHADGRVERLPAAAAELIALKVDVIFAPGPPESRAAQQATKTIPIVFSEVGDPVASGAVASLARPGGNITGVSTVNVELIGRRLALLKEVSGKGSRIAVLYDPNVHENLQNLEALREPAQRLGIVLTPIAAQKAEDFESAFESMRKSRTEALLVVANPFFLAHRKRISELTNKAHLPAMHVRPEFVEDDALMSYAPDPIDQARRAAAYVVKLFKGAKAAELPVEQPTKFEFIVNMKAARAIDLKIPSSILLQATKVIE